MSINNGATIACGIDDKWASSQLEQDSRVLPNTTRENKTNIVTVKAWLCLLTLSSNLHCGYVY
jgi:hypothetical protein